MSNVLSIRKISRNQNRDSKLYSDHVSIEESIDVTLSLSPTSNKEEVSWSSSDGSTYYSEGDEAALKKRHTRPVHRNKLHNKKALSSHRSQRSKVPNQISNNRRGESNRNRPKVPNQISNNRRGESNRNRPKVPNQISNNRREENNRNRPKAPNPIPNNRREESNTNRPKGPNQISNNQREGNSRNRSKTPNQISNPISNNRREESYRNKPIAPKKVFEKRRGESHRTDQPKKAVTPKERNLLLENVDNFPRIELATSSEELSAVGFLTTEDTAKVFCRSNIPFQVSTNDKLSLEISAISTSSSDDSSIVANCSRSDVAVRHYQENTSNKITSKTDWAAIERQFSDNSSREKAIPMISEHSVEIISFTYQDPVSSLEYETTWDDLSLTSDIGGDRNAKVNHPTSPTPKDILKLSLEPVASPQIDLDSKRSKIKQMERGKSETEERIKELKEKIKNIQVSNQSSRSVANELDENSSTEVESSHSHSSPSQRRTENAIIDLEGDRDTDISTPLVERHISGEARQRKEPTSKKEDTDISTPLVERRNSGEARQRKELTSKKEKSGEARQRKESMPKKEKDQRTPNHDHRQEIVGEIDQDILSNRIPLMIPVLDREEISVIQFDASPTDDTVIDVEAGKFAREKWVRCNETPGLSKTERIKREKLLPMIDKTKILLAQGKVKVLTAYDHVLPILIRNKLEFQEKPRKEQIIIIAIGALSLIFLILLCVMMTQ